MDDNFSNPNIEWKKSGFGSSEKLSLKINPREAAAYNAKKKNAIQQASPLTASDLPAGLKKIRNKIKRRFLMMMKTMKKTYLLLSRRL